MPKQLNRDETRAKISRFIEDYYTQNDKKPAIRDIAAGTGISVSSVFRILHEMEDDGTVKVEIKKQRSIVTKRMETEGPHVSIPVLGTVACGPGEEEEEHLTEYIRMPESLVGKGELFALIAKGESMIDAGIFDGDLIFVSECNTASNGEIVVALVDDSATVKRFYKEKDHIRLQPENDAMDPILVDNCVILGKVFAVLRFSVK